jgi:cytoskeletal protein CcmA (bactofilin family)
MARTPGNEVVADFNKIVAGTTIKGEVDTKNDIRIDGTVEGILNCEGKVVLGQSGRIDGQVNCTNAEIQGKITATIQVKELLSLKATAIVEGEVKTQKIAIEPGAKISGSIDMGKTLSPSNMKSPNATAESIKKSAS